MTLAELHTHMPPFCSLGTVPKGYSNFGTTHADHLTVDIPCAPRMSNDLIKGNYEHNSGIQIIDCFKDKNISHKEVEMVLIGNLRSV